MAKYNFPFMKNSHNNIHYIFDFDSTLVTLEGLEEFAKIVLDDCTNSKKIINELEEITKLGMTGEIPYQESISRRFELFKPCMKDIDQLIKLLLRSITPSIIDNLDFFRNNTDSIIVISGGFREWILPVTRELGLKDNNVFANEFILNKDGDINDFDRDNVLTRSKGKVEIIKDQNLSGQIYVIGDGFTDYQIKQAGVADKFFAFTENVIRESVTKNADQVVSSLDEFISYLDLE